MHISYAQLLRVTGCSRLKIGCSEPGQTVDLVNKYYYLQYVYVLFV